MSTDRGQHVHIVVIQNISSVIVRRMRLRIVLQRFELAVVAMDSIAVLMFVMMAFALVVDAL
jgi:hypothetical protein